MPVSGSPGSPRDAPALTTMSKEGGLRISLRQLLTTLETSERGLSSEEASRRLSQAGP
jgi:hypothetical protein